MEVNNNNNENSNNNNPSMHEYTKRVNPVQNAISSLSTQANVDVSTGAIDIYRERERGEVHYVLITITRQDVRKYLSSIPCLKRKYDRHVVLTFGLDLTQDQVNEITDIRGVHFVRIPTSKFESEMQSDGTFDKLTLHTIVRTLSKRFEGVIVNDKYSVEDLMDHCDSDNERKKIAIVVPFIYDQVDNLVEQLERWSSPLYSPCSPSSSDDSSDGLQKPHAFDLIFFHHRTLNETLQSLLMSKLSHNSQLCFENIIFRYAALQGQEDTYPIAANYMFYRLVHDVRFHTEYRYMFYCEPDAWALRPNWLQRVEKLTYGHPEEFWSKGSIYRGPRRDLGRLSVNIHVNGNGIYHLIDEYLLFLFRVQTSMPEESYDVAQTRLLFRDPVSLRAYWHKFTFTDFIQNLWRVEWREEQIRRDHPECYFVHGKDKVKQRINTQQVN